jgi:membrane fusion protein (multidrug efflux system)
MDTTKTAPAVAGGNGPSAPGAAPADAQTKAAPNPAVRTGILIAIAIVVIIALFYGIRFLIYALAHQTTDDAKIDADQVQITSKISERVDRVVVDTNQYVHRGQLLVQLDDRDETTRYSNAAAALAADQGQARAAQATVGLTHDQQVAQNQQNTGAIAQARAGIGSASADAQAAQAQSDEDAASAAALAADVRSAQAGVPGALQNLRKAQADLSRTESLVSTGDLSQQQLDASRAQERAAQSSYEQARQAVDAANANYQSAQQKYASQLASTNGAQATIVANQGALVTAEGRLAESSAPERVAVQRGNADAALAQVATARAQAKIAADNLSYTKIHSPIDGYVGQKSVDIGQTVSPGTVLLTIVPLNVYITANFKETQMGNIRRGQHVDVNIDAYKGVKFDGVVETISPASQNSFSLIPAQNASGNFVKVTQRVPVRIRFVNPDPKYPLRVGMSVETSVKVK